MDVVAPSTAVFCGVGAVTTLSTAIFSGVVVVAALSPTVLCGVATVAHETVSSTNYRSNMV